MWPFAAKEIKWARAALSSRVAQDERLSRAPELVSGAKELVNNPDWSVELIRHKKLSPEVFVVFILSELAERILTSGCFHVYRGIINSEGANVHALYNSLVDELKERDFYDEEDAKFRKDWVSKEIREIG